MDDLISRQDAIRLAEQGQIQGFAWQFKKLCTLPSAETEIIWCKDCKHRGEKSIGDGRYWCDIHNAFMYYCSDAEREEE